MCLVLFGYFAHESYPLILAFNRDEDIDRRTLPAKIYAQGKHRVIMGMDCESKGSWLGINSQGHLAFLSNHYGTTNIVGNKYYSRGLLLSDYLATTPQSQTFFENLKKPNRYRGLNLVFGEFGKLKYFNNLTHTFQNVSRGIHVLGNADLNAPWPKAALGKKMLEECLQQSSLSAEELFGIMKNSVEFTARDGEGVKCLGTDWEDFLDPIFIEGKYYSSYKGFWKTKTTTIVMIDNKNKISFLERTHHGGGASTVRIEMDIETLAMG